MIDVGMRQQDVPYRNPLLRDEFEQTVHFIARIDQHARARP